MTGWRWWLAPLGNAPKRTADPSRCVNCGCHRDDYEGPSTFSAPTDPLCRAELGFNDGMTWMCLKQRGHTDPHFGPDFILRTDPGYPPGFAGEGSLSIEENQ